MDNKKQIELLIKRNFKRKLEIFIFNASLNEEITDIGKLKFEDFKNFDLSKNADIVDKYTYSWQLNNTDDFCGKIVDKIDNDFDNYFQKKYNEFYDEYKKNFYLSENQLEEILEKGRCKDENDHSLQCHYCGITKNIIDRIIKETNTQVSSKKRFYTKRFYNRGKNLEIDQRDPNLGYNKDNIVLSCYWCNNAKSDEFKYREFKTFIAPAIRQIWEDRFGKIPEAPGLIEDDNK